MRYEEVKLEIADAKQAVLKLYLQNSYPQLYGDRKRPMVLICPGGGYEHVSPREGEPVALQFLASGCHAAVLEYDVTGQGAEFPQHLLEVAEAAAYIRAHAKEYAVAENQLLVAGFSAGAHLAASLGCFWHEAWLEKVMQQESSLENITKESYQPNGLILAYPVITAGEYAHRGSFVNIMGKKAETGYEVLGLTGKELEAKLSLEHQVTGNVPPVFMWHTYEDGAVPLENSLFFASALRKADVNFEYHVFPHGGHGYSLGTLETAIVPNCTEVDPQIPQWITLCKKWIEVNFS